MKEMHDTKRYVGNQGYQKTLTAIRKENFWPSMKKDIPDYIARCMEFQKFKVEHKHPTRFLQPLPIPKWKWEVVTIGFIIKLPRTTRQHDLVMVVVDELTKAAHFIPIKSTHKAANRAEIYMKEIVRLHGIPKEIVSDKDSKFMYNYWKGLFKEFRTNLIFSTSYHP